MVIGIVALFISIFLTKATLPLLLRMLRESGLVRSNWAGKPVPLGAGIVFTVVPLASWAFGLVGGGVYVTIFAAGWTEPIREWLEAFDLPVSTFWATFFLVGAMGFLGLMDDLLGSRASSGFRGHFRALLREGKLTTGAVKALGGGVAALLVSVLLAGNLWELLLNALLIALSANFINLLDLRPGRAVKWFLLGCLVILAFAVNWVPLALLLPWLGTVLIYFRYDLEGMAMMGDVGSNVLGGLLGLAAVLGLPIQGRAVMAVLLVLLHVYTEKYSLTETFERVALLRYFDELGRPDAARRR